MRQGAAVASVDGVDMAVIELLTQNSRRTFGDIGERVGLSASAVKRRVSRLEVAELILGYTTVLDDAKLGRPLQAFTELRFAGNARVDSIADAADGIPEVDAIYTLAGDPDALALIRVRDVEDLKRTIDELRSASGVIGTKTLIVLGSSAARHRTGRLRNRS